MSEAPHPIDHLVGQKLKLARTLRGVSQERLAELLGISFQQIQKYERGANRIGASRLYEIAHHLDLPISYFFEADERAGHAASAASVRVNPNPLGPPGQMQHDGLYEPAAGFDFSTATSSEATIDQPVGTRDAMELTKAFNRIRDPLVRRRLVELVKAMAELRNS